ncbi:MAG: MgtC/SapB family protein [Pseudomonadota bacterium]
MDHQDLLLRLGVALAIGILFGIERGWTLRAPETQDRASGIRSFALAGLIGGVSAVLGQTLGVAFSATAFLGFAAVFATFQWRESQTSRDWSATTALAGILAFLLGAMAATGDIQVAVSAAIVSVALLALREVLHIWLATLTQVEVRDGLILLAMAFLLLPLLSDQPIDPWGLLNLREIWILTTSIAGVSFLGYVAVRSLGPRWGILITAAAGGLASSTATTLSLARLARGAAPARLLVAGMLVAGSVMLARVVVIAGFLQPDLLPYLLGPIGAGFATYLAIAAWLARTTTAPARPDLGIRSPLDLIGALRMALLLTVVILVSGLAHRSFGSAGLYIVAAISGLADVDAITISTARMTANPQNLAQVILLAVAVNSASKAVLASSIGRNVVGFGFLWPSLAGIAVGGAVFWLL